MSTLGTVVVVATGAVVLLCAPPAGADLTGAGGGPIVGPLILRSSGGGHNGQQDLGPSGVFFGVGGMGYAEFGNFRLGGVGIGTGVGDHQDTSRSMLGLGGATFDLLVRPGDGRVTLPLGVIIGGGGYVLKDMTGYSIGGGGAHGGSMMGSGMHGTVTWDEARTVYQSPFFMLGPRIGFASEVIPWLRLEGSASFLAMFRDHGTSYAFVFSMGPIFGKFDMRPPNPACQTDYPGCRDRGYGHVAPPPDEPDADDGR